MSEIKVNLATLMRQAQKGNPESLTKTELILDTLLESVDSDGLSMYFPSLSEIELSFMQTFFNTLKGSLKTNETLVSFYLERFLKLDLQRAKELTLTFGVNLVEGGHSGLLYLSWSKGIFDEQ